MSPGMTKVVCISLITFSVEVWQRGSACSLPVDQCQSDSFVELACF